MLSLIIVRCVVKVNSRFTSAERKFLGHWVLANGISGFGLFLGGVLFGLLSGIAMLRLLQLKISADQDR